MKLKRLRVRNFRCYKEEIAFDFDELTAFIGKNDAGKSSVMDALDIFLNDGAPDKNDASKGGDGKDLTFICEFSDLPEKAVIDEDFPTSFRAEYLLNPEGRLEIHKTYSGHTASPKCTSVAAYALHPTTTGADDLLSLKNADLKNRAKELRIDTTGIDLKVNALLRDCIRRGIGELNCKPVLVPLNEDNAKKAWDGLKTYIPILALFKSDRASTDQDPEAQDPLKTAVKEALKKKEKELQNITAHVEEELRKIADATLEKVQEMDPALAKTLNPQVSVKKWDTLFNVSITGDDDIPINKRGSGVKRLVLLNFFRAKAEQLARERHDSSVIYAIEEPETSQHPNNQRMLVGALLDLSSESQVIVTTHTPMLARVFPDTSLRYLELGAGDSRSVLVGGPNTNGLFSKSLGVFPDNGIKLFVCVEGRNDFTFLKHIATALIAEGQDLLNLEKMEIDGELIFVPLGGSNLSLWTSRLAALNRPEVHLFDRDTIPSAPPKYHAEAAAVNSRERCHAITTGKREIENYLHFEAINEAYSKICNVNLGLTVNFGPFDDVPMLIAEKVHTASSSPRAWSELDPTEKERKASGAKRILNEHAAPLMNMQRLSEVDQDGEVLGWFNILKEHSVA